MKAVACLLMLSFAGYVSTQYAFQTGKSYRYEAQGRIMSGITEINRQFSGMEVKYEIVVTPIGPNTILLDPQNFQAVEVNAELENGGWRDGELQNETPIDIPQELKEYLESPIELTMKQGIVDSIKVEANLPTWAVNIKKAQASHWVLDTTGANLVLSGNLNRQTNSVRPEEANQESGFFYEVMENTVHGECETYYTVSQNGPFDTPYPWQQQVQPGQGEQDDEPETQQQEQQQWAQEQQNYQETQSAEEQQQKQQQKFRQQYFYQQQQQQQQQQQYDHPNAYQQYKAYKSYAQGMDSASAEDSQETQQGELPWPQAFDKFCDSNDQVYEIVKAINFTACKNKPTLAYSTAFGLYGRAGDNAIGTAWERAVITRFLACEKDRKQYTILKVQQEEQVNFGLRLNQKTVAGTVQNITLVQITKAAIPNHLQNPKQIQDLSYTFDPKEQQLLKKGQINHAMDDINQDNQSQEYQESSTSFYADDEQDSQEQQQQQYFQQSAQGRRVRKPRSTDSQESSEESQEQYQNDEYQTDAESRGELPTPSLTSAPLNPFPITGLHTSGMKKRVQDLMKEIVEDITTDKESMAESETLSKISTVAKILRYLNYNDIEELYHQIAAKDQTEEDQTSRQVFLDACAIAGTNPNIKFLIDLIQKKEITGEHAAQIIMTFPLYIRTPTQSIIKAVYELADSSAVESDDDQVKTTAVLALSNLLYQACVNTRISSSRYPVAAYGQFCDQKHAQRKYAEYFTKNVEKYMQSNEQEDKHWAVTYLTALGNLGIPEAIPVVQNILDSESDPYLKTKAVLALKHLIVSRSAENIPVDEVQSPDRASQDQLTDEVIESQVLPVLMAVAMDKGEHPSPRMAAISLLMYTTPADLTVWQQLAYSTWFAGSREVHSFIYTSLKSLAQLQQPHSPLHKKLQMKAKAVLSLAKPITPSMAKSHNLFAAEFFEHIQTGALHHIQWFGSKDSNIPNYMFYRNNVQYGNGALGANPMEFSVHGHTIQKLVNFFLDQYSQETTEQQPHPELQQIHEILGVSSRTQEEDPEASIRMKVRNEIERIISINEEKVQQWIEQAKTHGIQKLMSGVQINYQKTMHLMEHSMEFPNAMGLPMQYHFRMPVHVSVRGEVKLVTQEGFKDVQLQAELHPVYAWKTHGKVSFKVPFTGKKYQAGVQRHVVVETPLRALVRKAPRGQVVVAITPTHLSQGSPSNSKIDLVTFHQRPYTAIILDEFWPTSHKEGGKQELIHAQEEAYKNEETYGEDNLGMTFELSEESEYKTQHEGASGWVNFMKRFHAPSCFFNVGWLGGQHVRVAERKLSLDVSKSETKTLAFVVAFGSQENAKYRDLWQDSTSGSSQSSEESSEEFQQQSQESSYKTRGERRNQLSSDEQEQQEGTVIAIAVVGKRAPIRTPQENHGQVQKVLRTENPTTVQYLAQVSVSEGRVYVRAAAGEAANEAAQQLPQHTQSLQAIREIVYEAQNAKAQPDGCAELEGEYDAPKHADADQLLVLRQALLSQNLEVKVKAELQFGETCKRMPHEVKAVGKLYRGPEQTKWAQENSPQAQKCKEDEEKGFHVSPICIHVAEQQAAALNKAEIKFTFSQNLPVQFLNRTDDVEDFVKAMLYPYMSNDNYHQGTQENSIQFEAHMTPDKEFIDVTLTKPDSKISFRSVQTNEWVKAVLPLTATQSVATNVQDRLFRVDSQTTCSIQGNQVNTFDNVTYRFNPEVTDDCYQIVAKDCSGREPVAVLVKDVTAEQKEIILLVGAQNKIELRQKAQSQSSQDTFGQKNKLQVKINEQSAESLPRVIREESTGKILAEIQQTPNGQIQVEAEHFSVVTDGKYVVVYAANSMRNRTCGICSNFDGEKVGEFRGPKDCQLSSGSLMIASYSYQTLNPNEKSQCKIQAAAKQQIAKEQAQCLKNSAYMVKAQQQQQGSSARRMFPNGGQYLEASSDCTSNCEAAVHETVFDTVESVLKPFVWDSTKRARWANRVTDMVAGKIAQILAMENNADKISERISDEILLAIKLLPIPFSEQVYKIAEASLGFFRKALLLVINPLCQKTKCCEPTKKSEWNPLESAQQIENALADESDSDPSIIPYVTETEKESMTCEQKLEKTLAKSISTMAYRFLFAKPSVPEVEKKRIRAELERNIRRIVQRTMGSNSPAKPEDIQKLEEEIVRAVKEIFPDGLLENVLVRVVKNLIRWTLQRLNKHEHCNFPIISPRQEQAQQQQQQQQFQEQQQQSTRTSGSRQQQWNNHYYKQEQQQQAQQQQYFQQQQLQHPSKRG